MMNPTYHFARMRELHTGTAQRGLHDAARGERRPSVPAPRARQRPADRAGRNRKRARPRPRAALAPLDRPLPGHARTTPPVRRQPGRGHQPRNRPAHKGTGHLRRMCYRIRREIEDLFPPKTTTGERLIGCLIADRARRATRISIIDDDIFRSHTGLTMSGVSDALGRLRDKRHLEFRVIVSRDKDNRPVYAFRGNPPQYRVPDVDEFRRAWELCEGSALALPSGSWLAS